MLGVTEFLFWVLSLFKLGVLFFSFQKHAQHTLMNY